MAPVLVTVAVVLADAVVGAQEAAVPAARVVLPTVRVPVVAAGALRELVPLEVVLRDTFPLKVLLLASEPVVPVPALLVVLAELWQAARPTESTTAGTIVR